jgi:hypothetical protein
MKLDIVVTAPETTGSLANGALLVTVPGGSAANGTISAGLMGGGPTNAT